MSANPKSSPYESAPQFAEIVEIDSVQAVRLPIGLRVDGSKALMSRFGRGLLIEPATGVEPPKRDWDDWIAAVDAYQDELGELMPEGRDQDVVEPRTVFDD